MVKRPQTPENLKPSGCIENSDPVMLLNIRYFMAICNIHGNVQVYFSLHFQSDTKKTDFILPYFLHIL